MELNKSIVEQPLSGVDLNTAEQSMDELASKDNEWVTRIDSLMLDFDYADLPRELYLPDERKLFISKVDDGIFSSYVVNCEAGNGSYGEILLQLSKMTSEATVQALKAKGFIPKEVPVEIAPAQTAISVPDYSGLLAALQANRESQEIHIHIHKAEELGNLLDKLEKGKLATIGEVRTWHDGNKYQKTAQGWIPVRYGKAQAAAPDNTDAFKHSKLPAEQGKLHQNMTHDSDYLKPGKELEISHAHKFLKEIKPEFRAMSKEVSEGLAKFGKVSGRLKDAKSAIDKMKGRFQDRSLNSLTDAMGFRVVSKTPEEALKAMEFIKKNYPIVEEADYTHNPKDDGYRANHFLIQTPSGKVAEVQVKTENQQHFSNFTHDNIYKGKEHIKNHPDVKKFVNQLSNYLHAKDHGQEPGPKPEEPEVLKKEGVKFDWSKLKGGSKDA